MVFAIPIFHKLLPNFKTSKQWFGRDQNYQLYGRDAQPDNDCRTEGARIGMQM